MYAAVIHSDKAQLGRLFGDNQVNRNLDPTGREDLIYSLYDEDGEHLLDFNMERYDV